VLKTQNLRSLIAKTWCLQFKVKIFILNVIKKDHETTTVQTQPSLNKSRARAMHETTEQYHIHLFVITTTHVCDYCYKGFQATQMPLNKGHGIETSYIKVQYDILVINTRPQALCNN